MLNRTIFPSERPYFFRVSSGDIVGALTTGPAYFVFPESFPNSGTMSRSTDLSNLLYQRSTLSSILRESQVRPNPSVNSSEIRTLFVPLLSATSMPENSSSPTTRSGWYESKSRSVLLMVLPSASHDLMYHREDHFISPFTTVGTGSSTMSSTEFPRSRMNSAAFPPE